MVDMGVAVSHTAIERVKRWVADQRQLKTENPNHRVLADVCMETLHHPSTRQTVLSTHGEMAQSILEFPREMRRVEPSRIWEAINASQSEPVGGAGGLGIEGETMLWTGAEYGAQDGYGLCHFSLNHTGRRIQIFDRHRQQIRFVETDPNNSKYYEFLGELVSIPFNGQVRPVEVWLFNGFNSGDNFVPDFRLKLNGLPGNLYPRHDSQENVDQMHVLGAAGFRVAQHFGILGVDQPLADLVIGHDGHSAFFKFQIFLYFLEQFKDEERALQATRKLCVATIHAPQMGTIPRTTGEMVRKHYGEAEEQLWGRFGLDPGNKTNALFVEINLSKSTGVVSPLHLLVTTAEERALEHFASGAATLLPDNLDAEQLKIYADAVAVDQWLGMGTQWALDKHASGWRVNPGMLGEETTLDNLRGNHHFRLDLADAFTSQGKVLLGLLNNHLPRLFHTAIPENAIIFASLRRATAYKINLITAFLKQYELYDKLACDLNRPIFWLFGGLAHQDDTPSLDSLARLLDLIEEVNKKGRKFSADFLVGYGIEKSKWIFPGLAEGGCWVGCTNPLDNRSQGTEAFGPSYIKAAMNAAYVMGSDDGGAGVLSNLPTVHVYGPTTFMSNVSLHADLWSNQAIRQQSRQLLANGFIGKFRFVAQRIAENLKRFEKGCGASAPGMGDKIEAMLRTIAGYNGRVLLDSYLREARE